MPTASRRTHLCSTENCKYRITDILDYLSIILILFKQRRVIIISILMMSMNQKCNPVASIIGIFCHSTSTPELVIEMLAHAGLLTPLSAIHSMVDLLSKSHTR